MASSPKWARRWRVLAAVLALVAITLVSGAPRAEELGHSPWFPMVDPAKGAQETFELNTLGLIRVGGDEWRVCRGKYRSSVNRHDFFVTVGRPDLAARESSRRTTENVLYYGGLASALAGGALLFAHLRASDGGFDPSPVLGASLLGAGVVGVLTSRAFSGPALSTDDAEGLVVRYNERLRDHLDSGDAAPVMAYDDGPRLLPLLPFLAPGGAGVLVGARF